MTHGGSPCPLSYRRVAWSSIMYKVKCSRLQLMPAFERLVRTLLQPGLEGRRARAEDVRTRSYQAPPSHDSRFLKPRACSRSEHTLGPESIPAAESVRARRVLHRFWQSGRI